MITRRHRSLPTLLLAGLVFSQVAGAGEKTVISLRDFEAKELKYAGLSLRGDAALKIKALGDGIDNKKMSEMGMFAYAWIIDADTRQPVWTMDLGNTDRVKNGREFSETINLPKGDYEVYFVAYAFGASSWFSNYYINIDRRETSPGSGSMKKRGVFSWFEDFFGEDTQRDWKERSKLWGIEIALDDNVKYNTFTPPRERKNVVFKSTGAGEKARVRTGLQVKNPVTVGIYCLGEMGSNRHVVDYGWIINRKTRQRVWEMEKRNTTPAGGAKKNVVYDGKLSLVPGDYALNYITDDSHSSPDWNVAPPDDPLNYGITLYLTDPKDAGSISLTSGEEKDEALIRLTGLGDDEFRSSTFTLKKESSLRIYALGERMYSRSEMADHGWIINARTREKVWTMDPDRTEPAGGHEKNRMSDDLVTLPAGTYTVFYTTDGTHSYNDWNSDPPVDEEHWGITVYAGTENFSKSNFSTGGEAAETGVIAQIVRVRDDENRQTDFILRKRTKVRVYALGEGQNHEMYDFGWIEKADGRETPWEMTYATTFHAGGSKKNRMVNTTIVLEPGSYTLHYKADDSHSFNDWNSDPPDDPTMYGITLYEDE
ncbi:MAG TPA: hypothetical protein VI932_04320 [Bacteroidota bacterium]|nr:hypothetical protein [Bacteroidota bacterium]